MTPRRAHQLIKAYGSARTLWETPVREWTAVQISAQTEQMIANLQKSFNPEIWKSEMDKDGIKLLTFGTEDYPESLLNLYDPPLVLYVSGELKVNGAYASLAVVGSRKRTGAGQKAVVDLLPPLIQQGMVIVSGLAYGIDSDAHKCTLNHDGRTIAVLGSGLNIIYPAGNADLFRRIKVSGAVVSEYPPQFKARKWTFPARNRIIAALSDAVLVIEASEKSGALITADCATQLGKDVLAVPGSIHSKTSQGTNRLIQNGAKLIVNSDDIIEEYPHLRAVTRVETKKEFKDPLQAKIYEILADKPKDSEFIVKNCDASAAEVQSALTIMTIRGLITEYQGRLFSRTL